jgi:hypothetical protein
VLLHRADRSYSEAHAARIRVDLQPGDVLFVPAGWMHAAVASTSSVSLSGRLQTVLPAAAMPARHSSPQLHQSRGDEPLISRRRRRHRRRCRAAMPPSSRLTIIAARAGVRAAGELVADRADHAPQPEPVADRGGSQALPRVGGRRRATATTT